jgi:hypothetical protein
VRQPVRLVHHDTIRTFCTLGQTTVDRLGHYQEHHVIHYGPCVGGQPGDDVFDLNDLEGLRLELVPVVDTTRIVGKSVEWGLATLVPTCDVYGTDDFLTSTVAPNPRQWCTLL